MITIAVIADAGVKIARAIKGTEAIGIMAGAATLAKSTMAGKKVRNTAGRMAITATEATGTSIFNARGKSEAVLKPSVETG
jgi:hypothetical protein